jgi:hypothetical protein
MRSTGTGGRGWCGVERLALAMGPEREDDRAAACGESETDGCAEADGLRCCGQGNQADVLTTMTLIPWPPGATEASEQRITTQIAGHACGFSLRGRRKGWRKWLVGLFLRWGDRVHSG